MLFNLKTKFATKIHRFLLSEFFSFYCNSKKKVRLKKICSLYILSMSWLIYVKIERATRYNRVHSAHYVRSYTYCKYFFALSLHQLIKYYCLNSSIGGTSYVVGAENNFHFKMSTQREFQRAIYL